MATSGVVQATCSSQHATGCNSPSIDSPEPSANPACCLMPAFSPFPSANFCPLMQICVNEKVCPRLASLHSGATRAHRIPAWRRRAHFRGCLREQCQCLLHHPQRSSSLIKPVNEHPLSPTADSRTKLTPAVSGLVASSCTLYHDLPNVNDGVAARLRQQLRRCKSAVTAGGAERGMCPAQALCAGERCDQAVR